MTTTTLIFSIIAALAIGDLLYFFVHNLCKFFSDTPQKNEKSDPKASVFLSYVNDLKQKYRQNRTAFLSEYLLLDSLTLAVTLTSVFLFGLTLKMAAALLLCYGLLVLTFVDARTQYLPDIITKPLILIGLAVNYSEMFAPFKESVIGAIAGFGVLWGINTAFRLLRNKDGMGGGDFKLLAALGAWLGWKALPFIVVASSFTGIIIAVILSRFPGKDLSQATPFGPSLALAGIITLFWGEKVLRWYFGLYGM